MLIWAGCDKNQGAILPPEEFEITSCMDTHRQFQEGVLFNVETRSAEIFPIEGFSIFNDNFLMEADLIPISYNQILVSSEYGNHVVDLSTLSATEISGVEIPLTVSRGSDHFFFMKAESKQLPINNSALVEDFIVKKHFVSASILNSQKDTIKTFQSKLTHSDTLVVSTLHFPTDINGSILSLMEEEVYRFFVNPNTNLVSIFEQYIRHQWIELNALGEIERELNQPIILDKREPLRGFSISDDGTLVSYQLGDNVIINDFSTNTTHKILAASAPKVSPNGAFVSYASSTDIEVFVVEDGSKFLVSDNNQYRRENPSVFLQGNTALMYAEKGTITGDISNSILRKTGISGQGAGETESIFFLSDYVQFSDLDFLISRASQPVMLSEDVGFFLLFQHHLIYCD